MLPHFDGNIAQMLVTADRTSAEDILTGYFHHIAYLVLLDSLWRHRNGIRRVSWYLRIARSILARVIYIIPYRLLWLIPGCKWPSSLKFAWTQPPVYHE